MKRVYISGKMSGLERVSSSKFDVKSYLTDKFQELGIPKSVSSCSDAELLYYVVLFKEGMDLGNMAGSLMSLATDVYEMNGISKSKSKDILYRIKELKTGEIGLNDFENKKELACYLEEGV